MSLTTKGLKAAALEAQITETAETKPASKLRFMR
jgi:hypothetical protein